VGARGAHQVGEAAAEQRDGLALELALPGLVDLEHRPRAGAERAVVEEDDVGVEQELGPQRLGRRGVGDGAGGCQGGRSGRDERHRDPPWAGGDGAAARRRAPVGHGSGRSISTGRS